MPIGKNLAVVVLAGGAILGCRDALQYGSPTSVHSIHPLSTISSQEGIRNLSFEEISEDGGVSILYNDTSIWIANNSLEVNANDRDGDGKIDNPFRIIVGGYGGEKYELYGSTDSPVIDLMNSIYADILSGNVPISENYGEEIVGLLDRIADEYL